MMQNDISPARANNEFASALVQSRATEKRKNPNDVAYSARKKPKMNLDFDNFDKENQRVPNPTISLKPKQILVIMIQNN